MTVSSEDVGVILDVLRPYLTRMTTIAVDEARRKGQIPSLSPGTVTESRNESGTAVVLLDSGPPSFEVPTLVGQPAETSRVMVLFEPPSGAFIVGYIGGHRTPRTVGGRWVRSAPQSIAGNTVTAVQFDTVLSDTENFMLAIPGTTFTVPPGGAGFYLFTASIAYATAPPARFYLDLIASSYSFPIRTPAGGADGENVLGVSGSFDLNDGDTVQLRAWQTNFGPINATAYLEAVRLLD